MEYVAEGARLTNFARERKLTVPERLELFRKVCGAVQFAHQNLVVHRDLKPGNILVTPDGEPKLLDFGIARLLDPENADALEVTAVANRRLTLAYASPEQIRGDALTTATDVYSLGALLYELLTGESPHQFFTARPSATELARVICEQDPRRPSLLAPTPETRRRLRGDLDNVVLRAMAREPARRARGRPRTPSCRAHGASAARYFRLPREQIREAKSRGSDGRSGRSPRVARRPHDHFD
ncbi:MAG: serine/threonine-protein kinase [Chthoniobacterales bacterium]